MVLAFRSGEVSTSLERRTASPSRGTLERQSHLLDYKIRRCREEDLPDLYDLASLSGPGFTSLPVDKALLGDRLREALPLNTDDHLLMLEHLPSGKVVGCAAIKARSGLTPGHWNFRLVGAGEDGLQLTDHTVLVPTKAFAGASELGSLFLHPDHRLPGVGRFLSLSRLMLIGALPKRFSSVLWSELRGVVHSQEDCPFYDTVMGPLLGLSFKEADHLFALNGDASLIDYLPKQPIPLGRLPQEIREIITETHDHGRGARRLLESAGFVFSGVIDLFDGGPLMGAMREDLPMISKAVRRLGPSLQRALVADFDRAGRFECQVVLGDQRFDKQNAFGLMAGRRFSAF